MGCLGLPNPLISTTILSLIAYMTFSKLFLLNTFIFLCTTNSSAQSVTTETELQSSPFRLLWGAALELGGETVAEIDFENGDSQDIKSGQGGSIFVGTEIQFPAIDFLVLQATIGIKYVTTQADNAHIRLTRFPIEIGANYLITDDIRIGGGFSAHTNINLKADGIGPDLAFDNSGGPYFEASYAGFGLRYTNMSYTDEFGFDYDASSVGVFYKGVLF